MRLINDEKKVAKVTTSKGWVYRVAPGTFRTEVDYTEGDEPVVWFTFDAQGRDFMTTLERVAIRQSDVTHIVESVTA
jgi:hypothetical protein